MPIFEINNIKYNVLDNDIDALISKHPEAVTLAKDKKGKIWKVKASDYRSFISTNYSTDKPTETSGEPSVSIAAAGTVNAEGNLETKDTKERYFTFDNLHGLGKSLAGGKDYGNVRESYNKPISIAETTGYTDKTKEKPKQDERNATPTAGRKNKSSLADIFSAIKGDGAYKPISIDLQYDNQGDGKSKYYPQYQLDSKGRKVYTDNITGETYTDDDPRIKSYIAANSGILSKRRNEARIEAELLGEADKYVDNLRNKDGKSIYDARFEQAKKDAEKYASRVFDEYTGKLRNVDGLDFMYLTEMQAAHLKAYDLQKMADDTWDAIPLGERTTMINGIVDKIKKEYPNIDETWAYQYATQTARIANAKKIYSMAKKMNAPKNEMELFFRTVVNSNVLGVLSQGYARSQAGTIGDMAAREEAEQEYINKGHKTTNIIGTVAGFAADPSMAIGGGLGKLTIGGGMALATRAIGAAATRKAATTLTGRLTQRAIGGAVNFAAFEGIGEAANQYKWGGYRDPNTGKIGDYNAGKVLYAAEHGLIMGGVTGVAGELIGNVFNKAVKSTKSTLGKVGVRTAELGTSALAEGSIFAVPQIYETKQQYDVYISSLSDKNSKNYIADEAERKEVIAELERERNGAMMDVWTDNMAMIVGFKSQGLVMSARQRIAQLRKQPNSRVGFETRLRRVLDGKNSMALTKEEKAELKTAGYNDLNKLVEEYNELPNDKKLGIEEINRFSQFVEDKNVSERARAKMYYYVTGHTLPMHTVLSYDVSQNKDDKGNVTSYKIKTYGHGNTISVDTYKTKSAAEAAEANAKRQIELNTIDFLEKLYDNKLSNDDNSTVTPSQKLRDEISSTTKINIDDVIAKEDNRRTEAERKALNEYTTRLSEEFNKEDNSYVPKNRKLDSYQPSDPTQHTDGNYHIAKLIRKDNKEETEVYITYGNIVVREDGTIDAEKSDESITIYNTKTNKKEIISPTKSEYIFELGDILTRDEHNARNAEAENTDQDITQATEQDKEPFETTPNIIIGNEYTITDDTGGEKQVIVTSQGIRGENGDYIADKNGDLIEYSDGVDRKVVTKDDFINKIIKDTSKQEEKPAEETVPLTEEEEKEPIEETEPTETIINEDVSEEQEQPETDAMPMIGEGDNAEPDYMAKTPQRTQKYLYDEADIPEEVADNIVSTNLKRAETNVKNITKKIGGLNKKPITSPIKYKRERAKLEGELEAAQKAVKYWNEVAEERRYVVEQKIANEHDWGQYDGKEYVYNGWNVRFDRVERDEEGNVVAVRVNVINDKGESVSDKFYPYTFIEEMREGKFKKPELTEEQKKAQQEEMKRSLDKANEEVNAEIERQRRIAEEQRKQRKENSNKVGEQIREKWDNANKIDGRTDEIVLPNGETVRGRFVLHESGDATASHNSTTWNKSEGFPEDENGNTVNDRDYKNDDDARRETERIAEKFDQRALQSPVIVSRDGVVLSGNGRTIAGEIAARNGTDGAYIDYLARFADKFGFTEEQVRAMKNPRVSFEIEEDMPYNAETFAKFNQQEMKSQNKTELAVKLGKTVKDDTFRRVVDRMRGFDTLAEFYNNPKEALGAIMDLYNDGVISRVQLAEMIDGVEGNERLSDIGRNMLETMLVGKVFDNNPEVVRILAEMPQMRRKVVGAMSEIADNIALGNDWSLQKHLAEAVEFVYKTVKGSNIKEGERVSIYAGQLKLFAKDGELPTMGDIHNKAMLLLADAINDSRVTLLRKIFALYNSEARDSAAGQMDLFEGKVRSQEDILNDVINYINNGTKKEIERREADAVAKRKGAGSETPLPITESNREGRRRDGAENANDNDGRNSYALRKNWREKGKKIADKNWVLTAYDETSADSESPVATNKNLAGSVTDVSNGKGKEISNNMQGKEKELNDFFDEAMGITVIEVPNFPKEIGQEDIISKVQKGGKRSNSVKVKAAFLGDDLYIRYNESNVKMYRATIKIPNAARYTAGQIRLRLGYIGATYNIERLAGDAVIELYHKNGIRFYKKVGDGVEPVSEAEAALRGAVVDRLKKSGIEVFEDEEVGQRWIDEVNGEKLSNGLRLAMEDKENGTEKNPTAISKDTDPSTWGSSNSNAKVDNRIEITDNSNTNLDNLTSKIEKSGKLSPEDFLLGIENALGAKNDNVDKSQYFKNGDDLTLRIANHRMSARMFLLHDHATGNTSIVVKMSEKKHKTNKDVDAVEFVYFPDKLTKDVQLDIIGGLKEWIKTGEYNRRCDQKNVSKKNGDGGLRMHRVYHGSSADFDAFDHSHMGEGEGAQAYGWGTYVTEVEGIAKKYAKITEKVLRTYKGEPIDTDVDKPLYFASRTVDECNNIEDARKLAKNMLLASEDAEEQKNWEEAVEILNNSEYEDFFKTFGGKNLYSVEIPDDNGNNYLHYEEPLTSKQISAIREYLQENYRKRTVEAFDASIQPVKDATNADEVTAWTRRGENIYKTLSGILGGDEMASKALSEAGFVGISYPAEYRSGGRGDGKRNYVIFNEADAKIIDKVSFFRTKDGEAYGFVKDGKIFIDPRIAKADTPIHEYTHLWSEALRQSNSKEWENVVKLMRGTEIWDEVVKKYPELKSDSEIAEEVLAHYSGSRGAERLREEMRKVSEGKGSVSEKAAALSALERVKSALKRFWKGVADFFGIHFTSAEEVADKVMSDLLNGVNPNDFIDRGKASGKARMQFVGERGAEAMDKAEEASVRLDNLGVAREMEKSGKDAKAIKFATGWERGGDGKWRYEILDGKLKDGWREKANRVQGVALSEVLDNKELFDAYPHLKNLNVTLKSLPFYVGEYRHESKMIALNDGLLAGEQNVLVHEVQHAIQFFEGFERGGSTESVRELFKRAESEWIARGWAKELEEKAKELSEFYNQQLVEDALIKDYMDMGMEDWLPLKDDRIKGFNYFARGYADRSLDTAIKQFRLDVSTRDDFNDYKEYRKIGGEVESRNVEKRMKMSAEERRRSLASETEDVAREDQIFLENGIGASASERVGAEEVVSEKSLEEVNRRFNEELDAFKEKKHSGLLHIGKPGTILKLCGITPKEITISPSVLKKHLEKHGLTTDDIKGLAFAIQSPILVYKHGKNSPNIVVVTELETKGGKLSASFVLDKSGNVVEVSNISSIHSKDANIELSRLYKMGEEDFRNSLLWVEKEKVLNWITPSSYENSDMQGNQKPFDFAKVVENFKNPEVLGENVGESNKAEDKREAVESLGERFGVKIRVVENGDEITDADENVQKKKRGSKGWYDKETGEVVVVLGNNGSVEDVVATVSHEVVAHKGLRELIGEERYNDFLDETYNHLREDLKKDVDTNAGRRFVSDTLNNGEKSKSYEQHRRDAVDELFGRLGEKPFEEFSEGERTLWQRLKEAVRKILDKFIGDLKLPKWFEFGDNELRYILWRSKEKLERGVIDKSKDEAKREELGLNDGGDVLFRDVNTDMETEDIWKDKTLGLQERMTAAAVRLSENHKDNREAKTNAMRAIGGNLSDLRKAMSAQKEYDKTTVKRVVDLAKVLIKSKHLNSLSDMEVRKLLNAVSGSVGKQDIKNSVDAIMDIMINNQLTNAENTLYKLLHTKTKKINDKGVAAMSQLDLKGQTFLTTLKEYMAEDMKHIGEAIANAADDLTSDNEAIRHDAEIKYDALQLALQYKNFIAERIREEKDLKDELSRAKKKTPKEDKLTQSFREYKQSIEDAIKENKVARITAYADFVSKLSSVISESKDNARNIRRANKERVSEIHKMVIKDLGDKKHDIHTKKPGATMRMIHSFANAMTAPFNTFEQFFLIFGGKYSDGKGYLYDHFVRGVIDARNNELLGLKEKYKQLDDKAKELFGVKNWQSLLDKYSCKASVSVEVVDGGKIRTLKLTQGNALYIYMVNKMSDGKMKLRKMGISEEDVARLARDIDPGLIKLGDWLQEEFLPNSRDKYNATHERLFGAPMTAIENYFPIKINKNAIATKEEDLDNPERNSGIATTTGAIKERTKNSLPFDVLNTDALDVILAHIKEMEHFSAFGEINRDINILRTYKRFENTVKNMHTFLGTGDKLLENFNRVCQIAVGDYRPRGDNEVGAALVNIAKGVTASKIAFRVFTALKQFISYPAYIFSASPAELAKATADARGSFIWCMDNLPIIEERWKSKIAGDPRLAKTETDWGLWNTKFARIANKYGMGANAFVDIVTVTMGAKAIYETNYKAYLKKGYGRAEADRRAKQDATIFVNSTQQSSEGVFLSPLQVDRTWNAVTFSVFRNASYGYGRNGLAAARNLKNYMTHKRSTIINSTAKLYMSHGIEEEQAYENARKDYRNGISRNILNTILFNSILPGIWVAMGKASYLIFGNDEEEKKKIWKETGSHSLFGFLEGLTGGDILGTAMAMRFTGEFNAKYLEKNMPIVSDITNIIDQFANEKNIEAVSNIANLLLSSSTGVDPRTFFNMVNAFVEACGDDPKLANETAIFVGQILNIPKSQLNKMYFDELNLSGGEISNYTPQQLAERYAKHKVREGYTLVPWEWDNEELLDKYEKYEKKKITESLNAKGDKAINEQYTKFDDKRKAFDKERKNIRDVAEEDINEANKMAVELEQKYKSDFRAIGIIKATNKNINNIVKMYFKANTPTASNLCGEMLVQIKKKTIDLINARTAEEERRLSEELALSVNDFYKKYEEYNK